MPIENPQDRSGAPETDETPSRREIAKTAGKFLAYTAPALIALMTAKNAEAN